MRRRRTSSSICEPAIASAGQARRSTEATLGTWAGGATGCPDWARSTGPGSIDALYEGGFEGVLSVEHEDPVWGGSEEKVEIGLKIAHQHVASTDRGLMDDTPILEVSGLVKDYPGVRALGGVDLDVLARRGALHRRPERCRQVDLDQVHRRCHPAHLG